MRLVLLKKEVNVILEFLYMGQYHVVKNLIKIIEDQNGKDKNEISLVLDEKDIKLLLEFLYMGQFNVVKDIIATIEEQIKGK